jgi:hypothetical protein
MLIGMALLPLVDRLLLFLGAGVGAVLGALAGCGAIIARASVLLKAEVVELLGSGDSISRDRDLLRRCRWLLQSWLLER